MPVDEQTIIDLNTALQELVRQQTLANVLAGEHLRTVSIRTGIKTLAVANTAERISSDPLRVRWVVFTALGSNTALIAVGDGRVDATPGSEHGYLLNQLEKTHVIKNVDLTEIWWVGSTTDDGVEYVYGI